MNKVSTLWSYRHLVVHKAWADFRAESNRTQLGVLWWLLDPIFNTITYFIVFGIFFNRGGGDYVPFLVIGIVGWNWFSSSVASGSGSILVNANMVQQVSFPKVIFPAISLLVCFYKFCFSILVLLGALFLYGYFPHISWWMAVYPMVTEILLCTAAAFLLGSVVPFLPDLKSFIPYVLQLGFFFTGVMYRVKDIPAAYQPYMAMNPMNHVLDGYRAVLMHHQCPEIEPLMIIAAVSAAVILAGGLLIRRFDGVYAKRMV